MVMLLFGEWYLLLYIYCSSSTIAYSNAHYIIISRSVLSPSQMLLQDIVQIMCRSIIVVIKYYMDCIIKYMPYVNIVNGVLTSIDQLLELMIYEHLCIKYTINSNINMPDITKYS